MASPTVQGKTDAETVRGVRNPRTVAGARVRAGEGESKPYVV